MIKNLNASERLQDHRHFSNVNLETLEYLILAKKILNSTNVHT